MNLQFKKWISNGDSYYRENDAIDDYTIRGILGEGRYGIVYLAVDGENKEYIVKQFKKEMIKKSGSKLFYETKILKKLHHPCFPKYIANFNDGTREGYIMEYMKGKVFEDILQKDRHQFQREEIYEICTQLLDMVEILHGYNIVHRDIRIPNVIRKDEKELSLIDFGLARIMKPDYYTRESDYWYIGDFLIHLYYSTYQKVGRIDKPWFKELDLNREEEVLLKRLMGIKETYKSITQIRQQLDRIKETM